MSTLITRPRGILLLIAVGLVIILVLGLGTRAAVTGQEPPASASALQEQLVVPFLYPPFPGTAVPYNIFDHDIPANTSQRAHNGQMVTFNGYRTLACISDRFSCFVDQRNIYVNYDDHEGTDFLLRYRPVLAAAASTHVVKAGWYVPSDHTQGYGLMVTLRHRRNGRVYDTLYGHLSAIAVHECDQAGPADERVRCPTIQQGDVIGISGNTGWSDLPHLHFSVLDPNNGGQNWWENYIDPYGFRPADDADVLEDPWGEWEDPDNLWAKEPVLTPDENRPTLLPLGVLPALDYPRGPQDYAEARRVIVDDDGNPEIPPSFDFEQIPVGCWDRSGRKPEDTQGGAIHDYNVSVLRRGAEFVGGGFQGECRARWHLPVGWPSGRYNIYVHIPRSTDTFTDSAPYAIHSAGQSLGQVLIDQQEIRTGVHASADGSDDATVSAGWIFIGRYRFLHGSENYVELSNDTVEQTSNTKVAADAVQFVLINKFGAAPTPTPQPTPTPRPIGRTVVVQVRSGSDDAGPDPGLDCVYSPGSNEVYFGRCFNGTRITSGFRFTNVAIPRNSLIRNAYIDFTVDGPYKNAVNLLIYGEATGNAQPFGDTSRPDMRRLTLSRVPWQIRTSDHWELSEERRTPDLSAIIRQLVSRQDWSPGNAIAIIFKDNGTPSNTHRRVVAFERPPSTYDGHLARLTVTYLPSTRR